MSKWIAALALALASGALHAQQPGDLWEMNMSIGDGDMMMPMMSNKVCVPKDKNAGEKMLKPQEDKNCKTDLKTSGKKTKFKTVCVNDNETTTMEGTQEMLAADHFKTDATVTIENRKGKETMRQAMTMKKVGTCKTDPNPADTMNAEMRKSCPDLAESMYGPAFLDKNGICKADKALFCARVKTVAEESRDPAKYKVPTVDWDASTKACGVDFAAVTRMACQRSVEKKDWYFVTNTCPNETKELSAKYCKGRDYTSIMQSGHAQLCRSSAPGMAREQAVGDDAGAGATDAGSKKKDKGKNMLDMGKDMLKSLF